MMQKLYYSLILVFLTSLYSNLIAQTLVMNEVSQGEQGNQEYVEFVVVDTAIVYDCQNTQPPCIDIRGWIFDDNSGYHGAAGIAAGCIRFSFDPLWQCVPLGSIILVYNDADPNPLIPPIDVSMSDGNCSIVVPISDVNLFESNATTPGAAACSYPAVGWTAGGDWSNTLLANGGDCARIVDLAGCEVFSVCWNSDNLNNLIYFPGGATSPVSASNTVYYFNDIDPAVQSNWSIGCADVNACGVEEQTPGAPNNALNASFIGQFNNNCTPITPIVSNAIVDSDAVCSCTGQATASGSGSIPGYTYEWLDDLFNPIGQTTATAINLCGGIYNVIVTSGIGCADTSQVTISTSGSVDVGVNSPTICEGESTTLNAIPTAGGGTYSWVPGGQTTQDVTFTPQATGTYTVYYQLGSCIDSAEANVVVSPVPIIDAGADLVICDGESVTLNGTGGTSYIWDNGVNDGISFVPALGMTTYTVNGTDVNGCSASSSVVVNVVANPIADATFSPISGNAPLEVMFDNLGSGGNSYVWSFGDNQSEITATPISVSNTYEAGTYTITLTVTNGPCNALWSGNITVDESLPVVIYVPNVFTPNDDSVNDDFMINSENLDSLEGTIVNRWGNVILEFDTIDFTWDGTVGGVLASDGTYYVIYKAVGLNQKIFEGHTFFQLVR